MDSKRIKKLRNLLDRSQRATDEVTSIVAWTDAQLSELHSIMAPIQERTQCLSSAHKNLSRCVRCFVYFWSDGESDVLTKEPTGLARSEARDGSRWINSPSVANGWAPSRTKFPHHSPVMPPFPLLPPHPAPPPTARGVHHVTLCIVAQSGGGDRDVAGAARGFVGHE